MQPTLHSVAIFVTDILASLEFYRDTLELPLIQAGTFGGEFLEGPTHIGVHPANHPESKKLVGRETGITLHIPGLLHYCGVLHERGVRFLNEPTKQSWGIMAMIADPDGNVIALWEPPTDDQDESPGEGAE